MKLKGLPIEQDIWERFYAQMITALIIIIFPRKRYYIFIILAGEFPQDLSKFNRKSPGHDLFQMVENICLVLDAHHEMYCFLQFERKVFDAKVKETGPVYILDIL